MKSSPDKPDVETIIANIQQNVAEAEKAEPTTAAQHPNLETELAAANQFAAAGANASGFIPGIMRKLLGFLISDINTFQSSAVRTLNLLTKRVQAVSGEESERLVEIAQRTEAKQVELEKRIHALEQKLK